MGTGTSRLQDRMVRDAIVDVLHGLFEPRGDGPSASALGLGHVGEVTVDGPRAAVGLVLTSGWRPIAANLVTEAARRLQSLAEVDHFEIAVLWERPPARHQSPREKEQP